jgi:hypothetical protein
VSHHDYKVLHTMEELTNEKFFKLLCIMVRAGKRNIDPSHFPHGDEQCFFPGFAGCILTGRHS